MHESTDRHSQSMPERLRANDPATGEALKPAEQQQIRSQIASSRPSGLGASPGRHWFSAGAAAAVLVAAVAVALLPVPDTGDLSDQARAVVPREPVAGTDTLRFELALPANSLESAPSAASRKSAVGAESPSSDLPVERSSSLKATAGPADPARETTKRSVELRLIAPGGTQVVWTLDPDFAATKRNKQGET